MSDTKDQVEQAEEVAYQKAGRGSRFLNFIIDSVTFSCISLLLMIVPITLILVADMLFDLGFPVTAFSDAPIQGVWSYLLYWLAVILFQWCYYAGFEWKWGVTPGKLFTNTRVVTLAGGKPSFGQIVKRSLIRFIPFEAIFGLANGYWWHDVNSGTQVVRYQHSPRRVLPIVVTMALNLTVISILVLGIVSTPEEQSMGLYTSGIEQSEEQTPSEKTIETKALSFRCPESWRANYYSSDKSGESWVIVDPGESWSNYSFTAVNLQRVKKLDSWLAKWTQKTIVLRGITNPKLGIIQPTNFMGLSGSQMDFVGENSNGNVFSRIIAVNSKDKCIGILLATESQEELDYFFEDMMESITLK